MTTPFPQRNQVQIAQESILDLFGKQTYLGNSFVYTYSGSLADTSEHTAVLINNASSGATAKSMFLMSQKVTSTTQVYVRYYITPTVSAAGTPATPLNLRPAYATSSVLTVTTAPTASPLGTLMSMQSANGPSTISNTLFVIDPGYKLLVTAQAATGTPSIFIENVWYEL